MRVDAVSVERANGYGREYVKWITDRARQITEDQSREQRLAIMECVVCCGERRQGGTKGTKRPCGCCQVELRSNSTNIDVLCLDCAKRMGLCKHCGADIDLKHRRKRDFTPPV